jgi:hypothetical protein
LVDVDVSIADEPASTATSAAGKETHGRGQLQPNYGTCSRALKITRLFAHMHPYDLFRQWLEAVWALLRYLAGRAGFKTTRDAFTYEQGRDARCRLFGLYRDRGVARPFRDVLGSLFMKLTSTPCATASFFTPWPIAEMMGGWTFDRPGVLNLVKERGESQRLRPRLGRA